MDLDISELTDDNRDFDLNELSELNYALYKHQKILIDKIKKLETSERINVPINPNIQFTTNVGILADKNGTGRATALLSYIKTNEAYPPDKDINTVSSGSMQIWYMNNSLIRSPWQFIVCPHYLVNKWRVKLDFVGFNNYHTIVDRNDLQDFYNTHKRKLMEEHLILVSNKCYNKLMQLFSNYKFKRFIFDETQSINIPNCETANSYFTWFLAPNYKRLLFSNGYFNDVNNKYERGIMNRGYIQDVFSNLEKQLGIYRVNVFLKCSKNLLVSGRWHKIKNIICANPNPDIRTVLNLLESNNINKALSYLSPKKLDNSELTEDEKVRITETDICPICFSEIEIPGIMPCCKNKFCLQCVCKNAQIKNNCMICRQNLSIKNVMVPILDEIKQNPSKEESLDKILAKIKEKGEMNRTVIYIKNYNLDFACLNKYNILNLFSKTENYVYKTFSKELNKAILFMGCDNYDGLKLENTKHLILIDDNREIINKCEKIGNNNKLNIYMLSS